MDEGGCATARASSFLICHQTTKDMKVLKALFNFVWAAFLWVSPPYLAVGIAWLCSFGAFHYQYVTTTDTFYMWSVGYWVLGGWIGPYAYFIGDD